MNKSYRYRRLVMVYWIVALIVVPVTASMQWPAITWHDVRLLVILSIVAMFQEALPVVTRGSLEISLSLTSYLIIFICFGFMPEIVISQLLLIGISLLTDRYRGIEQSAANSVMFLLSSTAGAVVFRLMGGHAGVIQASQSFAYLGYFLTYFVTNHLILASFIYLRQELKYEKQLRMLLFDFASCSLAACLALFSVFVYNTLYDIGLLFVAVPIIAISYIFRLYYDLMQANQQFALLSKIGAKFTAELRIERALEVLLLELSKIVEYSCCTVYIYNPDTRMLEPMAVKAYSPEFEDGIWDVQVPLGFGAAGYAALTGEPVLITKASTTPPWVDLVSSCLNGIESQLAVPIVWEGDLLGVIMLGHFERHVFTRNHTVVISVLANQTAVAIQNAKRFQSSERRSQIDELTGLVNFRQFDNLLHLNFRKAEKDNYPLTLLVIDIDYFKQVNDTFGHLAGNEVLRILANRIRDYVSQQASQYDPIVARYGGEEFTILLSQADERLSLRIAEGIRGLVENTIISVQTLAGTAQDIQVTVSIGLSSFPEHADSPIALLRHADRAMYYGSKQAGRNRVATYQAEAQL